MQSTIRQKLMYRGYAIDHNILKRFTPPLLNSHGCSQTFVVRHDTCGHCVYLLLQDRKLHVLIRFFLVFLVKEFSWMQVVCFATLRCRALNGIPICG
jgi:hypothetical protein